MASIETPESASRATRRIPWCAGAAVLAATALLLASCSLAPDTFIGPPPEVERPIYCTSDQHTTSCGEGDRYAKLDWAVGPGMVLHVRLSRSEDGAVPAKPFGEVTGYLKLTNTEECDPKLSWSLIPDPEPDRPSSAPPLTATDLESASFDDQPIPTGTREMRVTLRRLDTNDCWVHVSWYEAGFD